MKKGYEIGGIWGLLFIIIAYFVVIGLVQNSQYRIQAGVLVPYNDISNCRIGESEYLTLRCEPGGNPVSRDILTSKDGTNFIVNTVNTQIESIQWADGVIAISLSSQSGVPICGADYTGQFSMGSCANKQLSTGVSYVLKRTCDYIWGCDESKPTKLILRGEALFVKAYVPQIGVVGKTLPSSENCIDQKVTSDLEKIGIAVGIIDKDVPESVTLQQNQERVIPRGVYRELLPITAINYNGNAAVCDWPARKIYGFDKVSETKSGVCIAVKGTTLLDGNTRDAFCCESSVCQSYYGLSSDYKCVNYNCIKAEQPDTDCLVDQDCEGYGSRFVDNADGTVTETASKCVSRKCQDSSRQVACNPTRAYPNNMCCKRDGNVYRLETCTQPLLNCDQLGANACCLATQSTYTVKPAPEGKYCCDKESDGIGYVTEDKKTCEGGDGCEWWNIPCHIGNIFRGIVNAMIAIGIFIIAVLVLLIILNVTRK